MPIFEKKSHRIRPVECLKLCLIFLCNTGITLKKLGKDVDLPQDVSDGIFFKNWHSARCEGHIL